MIKNLRIGTKIMLGPGIIIAMLIIVGLIAFNVMNQSSNGFGEYREMARDANLAGRL